MSVKSCRELTDDNGQDDQDDGDKYDPQFHVLPPQLASETSSSVLEHVGTFPH